MEKIQLTSPTEWRIMQIVWKFGKTTVNQVRDRMYPTGEKAYTTVKTYLDRLVQKRLLRKRKIGLVNFYEPVYSEEQVQNMMTRNLVSFAFDNSFGLLAKHLVHSNELSNAELLKIRDLIQDIVETENQTS